MIRRGALLAATLIPGAAWLLPLPGAAGAATLQEAGRDTITADTAAPAGDTVASDTSAVASDTARPLQGLPALPPPAQEFSLRRFDCDRDCLLDHNAVVLLDLLEREMPGLTMLRGSYYTGPHHFLAGAAGPGFTEVRVDGRPVPPLASGQVELTRLPVARLDRVTVSETPRGVVVEAVPVRRSEPRAYSRIGAATGAPDVNRIHALFTNGLGRHFEMSTGIELLNTSAQGAGGDRFDFWGSVAWLPGEEGAGVELQWRNQSLDRLGQDTASVDRREIHLVSRGRLGPETWLTVAAGNSRREHDAGAGEDDAGGEGAGDPLVTEVDQASVSLRMGRDGRHLTAGLEARSGPGQPAVGGRVSGGLRPLAGLRVTGGVSAHRWDDFPAWSVDAGVTYRPDLGVGLEVGAGGAAGVQGVARPLEDRADSLSFVQGQARASASVGPVSAAVRSQIQDLSRRLPFGGPLDAALRPGPGVTIGAVEGTLEAPLIPLSWLLGEGARPIRLVGTWRRQEVLAEDPVAQDTPQDTAAGPPAPADLYLPADQARIAAVLQDTYFRGDLEIRAEIAARHRSRMSSFDPATGEAGAVPGWTTADWNLMIKIKDVRIWWRVDNTRSAPWEDLVGIVRPVRRNIFGVKWEFFN